MSRSKFHVFTNLAISFDGKISTRAREHIDPSPEDRKLMDFHRSRAHALLVGANTLRVFKQPSGVASRRYRLLRKAKGLDPHPLNVILATKVDFDLSWPVFTDANFKRLLVVPATTSDASLKPFESCCQIFKYQPGEDFPQQIVKHLKGLGCSNLLIEGGGGVLFPWAKQDLVDEWNVTVCPRVIGGVDAPTMVEGEGFLARDIKYYRLAKLKKSKDEVFLQYKRR